MKPLEMKFKVGDRVRSTLEGVEGEFVVSEMQSATFCYYVHRDHCKVAGFWIHEKDLELAPKYGVGQKVRFCNVDGCDLYGKIESEDHGRYIVSCEFNLSGRDIEPI